MKKLCVVLFVSLSLTACQGYQYGGYVPYYGTGYYGGYDYRPSRPAGLGIYNDYPPRVSESVYRQPRVDFRREGTEPIGRRTKGWQDNHTR